MNFSDFVYYDEKEGCLRWSYDVGPRARYKQKAGHLTPQGYIRIKIQGVSIFAHRVVWIMLKGPIPEGLEIDHIDGNRSNNKIENLRLSQHRENMRNQKVQIRSTTGVKGVDFDRKSGLYRARVKTDGVTSCSMFSDIEKAEEWVKNRREKFHGNFHRHQ